MNKNLVDFFEDELKTNGYYQGIRDFAKEKNLEFIDVLSPIVNEYDDHDADFGPYRFVDAIEDFIESNRFRAADYEDLQDVIDRMWEIDFFVNY